MKVVCIEVFYYRISLGVDIEVGYYEHFKTGDLIVINDGILELIRGSEKRTILSYTNYYAIPFIIDWDKKNSARLSAAKLLQLNYVKDVTKQFMRDQKLNELGI